MGIYPPWINTFDAKTIHSEKPSGYALIITPPKPEKDSYPYGVRIDTARFLVQWLTLLVTTIGLLLLTNTSKSVRNINDYSAAEVPKSSTGSHDKRKHMEPGQPENAYPFTPNMPDVTKCSSQLTFKADNYMLLFVKNPPTIAENISGQSLPISYRYAVVVVNSENGMPQYFVTLESGWDGDGFLCVFDRNGEHQNYGKHIELVDENEFIVKALEIIKKEFGFDHIEELPLSSV